MTTRCTTLPGIVEVRWLDGLQLSPNLEAKHMAGLPIAVLTETVQLKTVVVNGKTQKIAKVTKDRPNRNAPTASKYTVQENDTLCGIAAKYLGSSSQYKALFNANKDKVSDPNILKPGTELTIPQK